MDIYCKSYFEKVIISKMLQEIKHLFTLNIVLKYADNTQV